MSFGKRFDDFNNGIELFKKQSLVKGTYKKQINCRMCLNQIETKYQEKRQKSALEKY